LSQCLEFFPAQGIRHEIHHGDPVSWNVHFRNY
jgi:hypothetical protein